MFKIIEKIGLVVAILVAIVFILGGSLFYFALKDLDNPKNYIYCSGVDKAPFADYAAINLQARFQKMYEADYGVKGYKLAKIITPKNITLEEYYKNNGWNTGASAGYEYFITDNGGIVQCGAYK